MGNEVARRALIENIAEFEAATADQRKQKRKSEQAKHGWQSGSRHIKILEDYITIQRNTTNPGHSHAIRGNIAYSDGIHYFQFHWNPGSNKNVVIGVATKDADLDVSGTDVVLGSSDQSAGLELVSRQIYFNDAVVKQYPSGKPDGFTLPNPIIMVLNMSKGTLSFKTDKEDYGVAMKGLSYLANSIHVAAELSKDGDHLTMKYLGQTDKLVAQECGDDVSDLCFHDICGKNVLLQDGKKRATRKNPKDCFDFGTVLTNRPLKDNEMFKLLLVSLDKHMWRGSWMFGVTTTNPMEMKFGQEIRSSKEGNNWIFSSDTIHHNGKSLEQINVDIDDLETGSTVAVKKRGNELMFYIDGCKQATMMVDTTEPLFGVVDVYGQATCVALIDAGEIGHQQAFEAEAPRTSDEYLSKLKDAVDAMKTKTRDAIPKVKTLLSLNLDKIYHKVKSRKLRQLAAEKLANMDAAPVFTEYLKYLKGLDPENDELVLKTYASLLSVCWNYSDNSLLLSKKFGEAGLLDMLIGDLRISSQSYKSSQFGIINVHSCFGILHNCAKAIENKPIYRRNSFMEVAKPYCDAKTNIKEIAMPAVFTKSYVFEKDEIDELQIPEPTAQDTVNTLAKAVVTPNTHQHDGWHAYEIAVGIRNLAQNKTNIRFFVQKGAIRHLVKMLDFEDTNEQECGLNAIWSLITEGNKGDVGSTMGLRRQLMKLVEVDHEGVQQAAIRVKMKLQLDDKPEQLDMLRTVIGTESSSGPCHYKAIATVLKDSFKLSEHYFETSMDICFCATCHGKRGDEIKYTRGHPPKEYGVPVGWYRFGLKLPAKAQALNVLDLWHRAFHGTRPEHIRGILEVGEIVPAGRAVIGGKKVKEQPGHFNDYAKPRGFNTKQVFLSPSMRYAGKSAYATPNRYTDPVTKKKYRSKVAFQVLIKPDSYEVGPETVGAYTEIDPGFSNQELEWSTDQQGSIILYGLLVKLDNKLMF